MYINMYLILGIVFLLVCVLGIVFYFKNKSVLNEKKELSKKEIFNEEYDEKLIKNTKIKEETDNEVYDENHAEEEKALLKTENLEKETDTFQNIHVVEKEDSIIQDIKQEIEKSEIISPLESEEKSEYISDENEKESQKISKPQTEDQKVQSETDSQTECAENTFDGGNPQQVSLETPEPVQSRMTRLRSKLAKSGTFGKTILNLLSKENISETDWEEIEDTLLMADLGIQPTLDLIDVLREKVKIENVDSPERVKEILYEELLKLVDSGMDRSLKLDGEINSEGVKKSASIIMVGVNGVGKTTTAGKLARVLVAESKTVLLGAADTFRAAASEQLSTWGERIGVEVVSSEKEGADPASVAFEAVKQANAKNVDVVIVDTAGRLQNKKDLMDELSKIKRVMSKEVKVNETLLVLDATTGQNGMKQAEVFAQVADVTGIVLTKLDGTAKGGIVISVQKALGVPVKFVGLGEGIDDLSPFAPEEFVKSLLS